MSSISYQNPLNAEATAFMTQYLGSATVADGKSFLYDDVSIEPNVMSELADVAGQPVTVAVHAVGEIKTMADGTQYQVTKRGWLKV